MQFEHAFKNAHKTRAFWHTLLCDGNETRHGTQADKARQDKTEQN